MRRKLIPTLLISLLVILALACGSSAPAAAPSATPNLQATIDAGIAATAQAQAGMQATIDAAIAATAAVSAATLPPPTAALATAAPTTAVVTDEYVEMTEEELQALIDQAVNDAVTASTQASAATTQATADDSLTTDEVQQVEISVAGAEQAVAYAEELIQVYNGLYGDLAAESIDYLLQVEDDIETIAANTAALTAALAEVESTLSQGLALAADTITQLENTAQQVNDSLSQVQTRLQDWKTKAQTDRDGRADTIQNVKPDNVPGDLQTSLQAAFDFVDQIRNALGDKKLSRDELNRIAQLGANATAGLNAHGGPKLKGLSGKISEITGQLARGQISHAQRGLGDFERSLGDRPKKRP